MQRVAVGKVRPGWQAMNHQLGLIYNNTDLPDGTSVSYWQEGPYFTFTLRQVDYLEQVAKRLFKMMEAAGDYIVQSCPRHNATVRHEALLSSVCNPKTCIMSKMAIPEFAHEQIIRTWYDNDKDTWGGDFSPSVYARYDLCYDGSGPPKLLEFNADTPTSLVESAVIQWHWMEQTGQARHEQRQWNIIHEDLVEAWKRNISKLRMARPHLPEKPKIFFAYETSETSGEDRMNTAYLMETARLAGFPVELIAMSQIGFDSFDGRFYAQIGKQLEHIDVIFKLYPWEDLWNEEIGKKIFNVNLTDPQRRGTVWIEPPYKALWSNKGVLAVLWKLFGDKPGYKELLLPTYFADEKPTDMTSYAMKPLLGREGGSVRLVKDGQVLEENVSGYGVEGYVYQALALLPEFNVEWGEPLHPVLGIWMVDGVPSGMGIRESQSKITNNLSHFIPHIID